MARPLPIEYPGAFYHVINHGNAGENIFKSKRDREKFLEYLEKAGERVSTIIHTYCLMDSDYHLLMETPESNLSVASYDRPIQLPNKSEGKKMISKHFRRVTRIEDNSRSHRLNRISALM